MTLTIQSLSLLQLSIPIILSDSWLSDCFRPPQPEISGLSWCFADGDTQLVLHSIRTLTVRPFQL